MVFFYIMWCILYLPVKLLFPTKVFGKKNMPKKQAVVTVSNHMSFMDVIIVSINVPGFRRIIGKKELGNNRFVRFLGNRIGAILIDRNHVDLAAIRACMKALKKGQSLTMFPEGTRNKTGGDIQEVKHGAAMMAIKGGVPVLPIMIAKKPKLFRKNYLYIDPPFSLSAFGEGMLDSAKLNEAAGVVSENMHAAKAYLDDYVQNKRWREERRQKKAEKRGRKTP